MVLTEFTSKTMQPFTSLIIVSALFLSGAHCYCGKTEKTAYSSHLTYRYPRSFGTSFGQSYLSAYDEGLYCEVLFKPYYDGDGVRLRFVSVDLEPPRISFDFITCSDKIVVYDGGSPNDPILTTLCGTRTATVESSGSELLLVFSSDHKTGGEHKGYAVEYERIDRGGSDRSSGLGAGTLAAIIVPTVLFYACIFYLVYRRCKTAHNIRRNLAATGHTPEDLRMAMASVVQQAQRQPLTSTTAASNGHSTDLNQVFLEHMNANRDRRLGRTGGGGDEGAAPSHTHSHPHRVRHPAGEHSGRASPYYAPSLDPEESPRNSPLLNNLTADYNNAYPYHLEDDRRSHGSGRSGRSGRSQGRHRHPSPRPHSHRGEDSASYTYYGNVDEPAEPLDPAVMASAPNYDDVVTQPPPPSYEEAATGKYDPKNF